MKTLIKITTIILLIFSIYTIWDDIERVLVKYTGQSRDQGSFKSNQNEELPKLDTVKNTTEKSEEVITGLVKNIKFATKGEEKLTIAEVLKYTNLNRTENNIAVQLTINSQLNSSAYAKMQDMFTEQYFEHESKDGLSVGDLASKNNYEYITIGENLALGNFKNNKDLVDAWMDSPGHRANILSKNYTQIGIAVGYGKYKGENVWLAVQHFGTPRSICPKIDTVLSDTINITQGALVKASTELKKRLDMINSGAIYQGMNTNEQVSVYNNLVNIYNKDILEIKKEIAKYNTQVKNFNACLEENTE